MSWLDRMQFFSKLTWIISELEIKLWEFRLKNPDRDLTESQSKIDHLKEIEMELRRLGKVENKMIDLERENNMLMDIINEKT